MFVYMCTYVYILHFLKIGPFYHIIHPETLIIISPLYISPCSSPSFLYSDALFFCLSVEKNMTLRDNKI